MNSTLPLSFWIFVSCIVAVVGVLIIGMTFFLRRKPFDPSKPIPEEDRNLSNDRIVAERREALEHILLRYFGGSEAHQTPDLLRQLIAEAHAAVMLNADKGLTFKQLRTANLARLPQFKDKHGRLAHRKPDGSDWSPAQWLQAVTGELGEYANVRKKFERGDLSFEEYAPQAAKELADVQTYLDILALRCLDRVDAVPLSEAFGGDDATGIAITPHAKGVNLGEATREKFNEVSKRVRAEVWL